MTYCDIGIPGRRAPAARFHSPAEEQIQCAWCEKQLRLTDQVFTTQFAVRGFHNPPPGFVSVEVEGIDRCLALLIPPNSGSRHRNATEVIAVCCSTFCQKQLAFNWSEVEREVVARS
jgi:hypothetical protein